MKWIVLLLGMGWAGCQFGTVDQFERCSQSFQAEAKQFCKLREIGPPGTTVSMRGVMTKVERQSSSRWDNLSDPKWTQLADELMTHGWQSSHKETVLKPTNLGSLMLYFSGAWLLVASLIMFPMCCCCTGRKKLRKPTNLFVVFILSLGLTIAGAVLVIKAIRESSYLETGIEEAQCVVPNAVYNLGFLITEGFGKGPGRFEGLVNLGQIVMSMASLIQTSIFYLSRFSVPNYLESLVLAPYTPLTWTGYLLADQEYDSWLWATNGTRKLDTKLNHYLLGNEMLKELGVLDNSTGPFSPIFRTIQRYQPDFDTDMSIDGDVEDAVRDAIDAISQGMGAVVGIDTTIILDEDFWRTASTASMAISIMPAFGVLGGFALFVAYMAKSDNHFQTRHVSTPRLFATGIMSFGYALYGITVLAVSGILFLLLIFGRGSCDLVDNNLKHHGSEIAELFPGGSSIPRGLVEECLVDGTSGNILKAVGLDSFATLKGTVDIDAWGVSPEVKQTAPLVLPNSLVIDLPNQDPYLSLVLTKFESLGYTDTSLSPANAPIFWSGLQELDLSIDCSNGKLALTCSTLTNLKSSNTQLPTNFDHNVIRGLKSVSKELTRILEKTRCGGIEVCAGRDSTCNNPPFTIDHNTVGPPPDRLNRFSSWESILSTMPRTDPIRGLFACFTEANRDVQNEWLHATYYTALKSLALSGARRISPRVNDQSAVYPSFSDTCPLGMRCTPFHSLDFTDPNLDLDDTFVSYSQFRMKLKNSIESANNIYDTQGELYKVIRRVANYFNPLHHLVTAFKTLEDNYNCGTLNLWVRKTHTTLCHNFFPIWANLLWLWFWICLLHFIAFVMSYTYLWCRKRSIAEGTEADNLDNEVEL